MKLSIFTWPLQHGHVSGATSYTRVMSMAHVEIESVRGRWATDFWEGDRRAVDAGIVTRPAIC